MTNDSTDNLFAAQTAEHMVIREIQAALWANQAEAYSVAAQRLQRLNDSGPVQDLITPPPPEPVTYNPRPWQFTPAAFQNTPDGKPQSWRHLGVASGTPGGSSTTGAALTREPYTGHTGRMNFPGNKGPDEWHEWFTDKRLSFDYWSTPMPYIAFTARICDSTIRGDDGKIRLGNRKPASSRYISPELYEQRMEAFTPTQVRAQVLNTLDIVFANLADKQTTVVWVLSQESDAVWYGDSPMTAAEGRLFIERWNVVNDTIQRYRDTHSLPWYTSTSTGGTSKPRDDMHRDIRSLLFGVDGWIGRESRPDIVSVNAYDHSGTTTGPDNWMAWDNPLSGVKAALDRAVAWNCLFGIGEFNVGKDINHGGQNADRDNPEFLEVIADTINSVDGRNGVGEGRLSTIDRQWPKMGPACLFWSDSKGYTLTDDETPLSLERARTLWGDQ